MTRLSDIPRERHDGLYVRTTRDADVDHCEGVYIRWDTVLPGCDPTEFAGFIVTYDPPRDFPTFNVVEASQNYEARIRGFMEEAPSAARMDQLLAITKKWVVRRLYNPKLAEISEEIPVPAYYAARKVFHSPSRTRRGKRHKMRIAKTSGIAILYDSV